jgi:hypothetical protein
MRKLFIVFAILVLLVLALICFLNPTSVLGPFWIPWVIGAAIAWAVGRFLDELEPHVKT